MAEKKTTKKPTVKKTAAKKVATKKATPVVKEVVVETHPCGCTKGCACAGKCCHKGGFVKKLILFLIIFSLGFVAAQMLGCKGKPMMPRPEFKDGCMVATCPKMAEMAPKMDENKDGCVSIEEFKASKKPMMRKGRKPHMKKKPVAPVPAPQPNAE